jgi:hypothetical protein
MPHTPGHTDPQQQGAAQGAPPDEFELLRRRLKLRGATRGEEQQQDLNRRFAAQGNLPSGAAFKIRQQAQQAADRQTSEDLQSVNIAQLQTQRQEREAEKQRAFAGEQAQLGREFGREERIGAQQFAGEQARLGEAFATREREAAQGFGSEQARLAREFATGERVSAQDFAASERTAQNVFLAAEAATGREFTAGEAELARTFAREEAETGRAFAQVQQEFQQAHEASMQALGIASNENIALLDRELKQDGIDIQRMLADSQIETAKAEGVLNSLATFTNSIAPLREAGMNPIQIAQVYKDMDIGLDTRFITKSIAKNFPEFTKKGRAEGAASRRNLNNMTPEEWWAEQQGR